MPRKRVKIIGSIGSWTAEVEGERLPVIHHTWRKGRTDYHDPMKGAKLDGKKYQTYAEALKASDRVVVQKDADSVSLRRDGYVGVFTFKDLRFYEDGSFSLTLIDRIADPLL